MIITTKSEGTKAYKDIKPNFDYAKYDYIEDRFAVETNNKSDIKTNAVIQEFDIDTEIDEFPLIPYPGRIYVIEEEIIKTSGGLYVPPSARKDGEMQTNIGWVVAVGDDVEFCVPGDRIFYGRYSGAWVLEQKYRVMNEKDVLGRYK